MSFFHIEPLFSWPCLINLSHLHYLITRLQIIYCRWLLSEEFWLFCALLLLYVLTTPKVISGQSSTCDSVHSWQLHSAARLGDETTGTMTQLPTQSHYPDTVITNPYPILIMLIARLGREKYQFYKSLVWLGWDSNSRLHAREACTLPVSSCDDCSQDQPSSVCIECRIFVLGGFSMMGYVGRSIF